MKSYRLVLAGFLLIVLLIIIVPVSAASPIFTHVTQWGSSGSGNGQFSQPEEVAINTTGYIYVTDNQNNRIQVFDPSGNYVSQWGSAGSGNGKFEGPSGIAVNTTGYVYVTDYGNGRIQAFDPSGAYVTQWGGFYHLIGVAVNTTGYVYVADSGNNQIKVFDPSGTSVTLWGSAGSGNGQFNLPWVITVNTTGYAYVSDWNNNRIQVFGPSGNYVSQWGSAGSGNGQFDHPYGVAIDSTGYVYVADSVNNRIQVFDLSGNYVTQWGSGFNDPSGIAVNSTGYIYVADAGNNRIQEFLQITPPVASFTATPRTGTTTPLTVQFNDTSAYSPDQWNWSFGDGQWYNTTDDSLRNITHEYTQTGSYTVSLSVQYAAGSDTSSQAGYITITLPTTAPTTAPNSGGHAARTDYWVNSGSANDQGYTGPAPTPMGVSPAAPSVTNSGSPGVPAPVQPLAASTVVPEPLPTNTPATPPSPLSPITTFISELLQDIFGTK
ncbi:NHL repeat containing protein [Methanoregula boonei 6A8]|jgi:DNA-binding beta-propeller fold protein YncE|uniref:NHL repeat containing protein n=1 Tax=Methanoregula boonei (strain DSM 21154 / JCM 14090 / 6A8) TaxID=456442 RepID=A7I8Q7_METB6|nr:6-bladed beta-propeller [Methanoregula boonei]ABS56118.1 NHL repeat containing protein [Methanoregula boonei 6A8]